MLKKLGLTVAIGVSLVSLASASAAVAQEQLVVAGFAGSFEETMRAKVFPKFEEEHNVQITYVSGNSSDTLAKLQAQQGNQEIDVAFIDDLPMSKAISLGLCDQIAGGMDLTRIFPPAVMGKNNAIILGTFATGLAYNTKVFEENGWEPPTSWMDLKDPKYQGKVVIPPISNGYGMLTLVMMARLHGGSEENIDPGFEVMKNEVDPNVLAYEATAAKQSELFQTGQVVLGVWGSSRVQTLADSGFPIDFVYPEEGSPLSGSAVCPVAKENANPLAQDFINYLFTEEVQQVVMSDLNFAPVAQDVVLENPGSMLPYGANLEHAITVNQFVVNENWSGPWTERWNREIER